MGVLDYVKTLFRGNETKYGLYLSDSVPIFTSFGNNVYLSDFVNNAIERVASEISKIDVKSIMENSDAVKVQRDEITRLFRYQPNPLQTTSDFLANVEWLRRKNGNAFIYPQYETLTTQDGRQFKRYLAFYPLKPQAVYIGVRNGVTWEVKLDFEDGSSFTLPYSELIHLKWRRGSNTIIGGGGEQGTLEDANLLRTVQALDKTIQGLPKSIEASLQIKGVYSARTLADKDKMAKIRGDFEDHIFTSQSGIIATDMAGEFTPVNIRAPQIPPDILKFLKAVIEERYGVSAAILSGDYNGAQHAAFYQTAIEEFIIQFEQAFTACLFTARQQDLGHKIKCYYDKVRYMATPDKLNLANLAKESGIMTLNQINAMFGLEPFADGDRRLQSLNYVNLQDIDAYQRQRAGVKEAENDEA